ncbi:transcription factor GATA-6 [Elysia marginata]|uniref:Transcription factor GATA-6 n=1 Tax=Elysia marginata TaxID=1093978 RepID=A0AAV4K0N6_9GAST|nr:transcription factor GATA-6 [Elysia marginata]
MIGNNWRSSSVNRPLAMKKDGIQTRKRKPKNANKTKSLTKTEDSASETKTETTPPKSSTNSNKKTSHSSPKTEPSKTLNSDQSVKTSQTKSPIYNSTSSYNSETAAFGPANPKAEYPDPKDVSSLYTDPSKSTYNESSKSVYNDPMKSVYADTSKSAYFSDQAKMNSDFYKSHYPFGIDSTGKQQNYMNFAPMNMAYLEAAKSAGYYFDPSASRSMYYPGFDPKTSSYHSDGSPTGMGTGGVGTDYSLTKSDPAYLPRASAKHDYMDIIGSGEPYYMSAEQQHHYQQHQQQQQQEQQRIDCSGISIHPQQHQHQQQSQMGTVVESSKSEYSSSGRDGQESALVSGRKSKGTEFLLPGQIKAEYPATNHHHQIQQQQQQTQKHQPLQMHPHPSPQPFPASNDTTAKTSSIPMTPDSHLPHHHHHPQHHHHHPEQQQHSQLTSSSYALSSHSIPSTVQDNRIDDSASSSYRAGGSDVCPSSSGNSVNIIGVSESGSTAALHSVPVAS